MKKNNKPYGQLEDGTIKNLYYLDENGNIDYSEPRMFYKEGRKWYLMFDIYEKNCILTVVKRIVKFLTEEEAANILSERGDSNASDS